MLMSPMRDGTTSEDSATQLLICEPLSFAITPIRNAIITIDTEYHCSA